jgi:peptide deformylase
MNLIKHPNPWLDRTVKDFDFSNMDAVKIEQDMIHTMIAEKGIGLAANQVELDAKIFVIQPQNIQGKTKPFAVINPIIQEATTDLVLLEEGCLSFPKLYLKISRPHTIVVKYLDSEQKECIMKLTEMDARIFLHEFDHLYGINFIDRVSKVKLEMALKKQQKLLN